MRDSARTPKAAGPAAIAAVALAAAAALALPALLAPPVAQAAAPIKVAGWGQGAGKVNGPRGVAVNGTGSGGVEPGTLYVADRTNFRIDRFGPEGDFQLSWGWGVADGRSQELQVCGPGAPLPTKRCFIGSNVAGGPGAVNPVAVAIDQETGDVYVADDNNLRVTKFTPDGAFLYMLGKEVNKTTKADICTAADLASDDECGAGLSGTGPGEFTAPSSPSFDDEGKLWVNDAGKRAQRFDTAGAFLEEVPLPSGSENSALAVNPLSGDIYVLGPAGHNETQYVNLPNSGTYTLGFEGQTTEPIPAGANREAVRSALEALSTIGSGNVITNDPGIDPAKVPVIFIHDLGGRDVPQLIASGGSPPVTVETSTQGTPGSVRKLDPAGALIETLDDAPGDIPKALATDAAGDLYVGDAGLPYHFLRFSSAGEQESQFGAGQVLGHPQGNALAVGEGSGTGPGTLYAASSVSAQIPDTAADKAEVAVQAFQIPAPGPLPDDQQATDLAPTGATLRATLNPEGHATTYHFEYDTAPYEGEAGHGTKVPVPDATLPGSAYEAEGVAAELEGLTPDTTYHFRLVASNECGPSEECTAYGEDTAFRTPAAVGIEAQWATDVAARGATLHATLDPRGVEGAWWLEYGASPCSEGGCARAAEGSLPASFGEVPLAVALTGLEPATIYHYRFVAKDTREGHSYLVEGDGRTFTTQLAGLGFALPDGRAWEMVSPPDKHGGRISAPDGKQGGQVQAAADGEALAYLSYGSLEADPEGNRIFEQSTELSRRAPGGGWSTQDITPPHATIYHFSAGSGSEYKLFSPNLAGALLQPPECAPLSPQATERTPYLRDNSSPPTYTPLVTAAEVPPGTEFGGECAVEHAAPVNVRGATPDLSHVVLSSVVPLAEGAGPNGLYEWSAGTLTPLSVPPGKGGAVQGELGSGIASVKGAVSGDGSRIFWTAGGLYLSDGARGAVRLDDFEQHGGFGGGEVAPLFQGASADGSVAFFTDTQNLTEDANEEGVDLYRYRVQGSGGCEEAGGCLEDLSAGVASLGESAEVLGLLPGFDAEAGSSAYFVARGALASNTVEHGAGPEAAIPGQPNLYLWREGEGVRFVARLAGEDERDWSGAGINNPFLASRLTAAASPDGRYLAFMSGLPLTGYDNRALGSGERVQEVFRYDSASGALACVSCNPSGARPRALVPGAPAGQLAEEFDPNQLWEGEAVAAVVPEATKLRGTGSISTYTPRYIQNDGRVFFNAADSLVPADSNGDGDVYEYEPAGVGTCGAASGDAGTAVVPGGCVSLISSDSAEGTAAFLDASQGARDVFFYSPARLSVIDEDSELDVYDAREEGQPARLEPSAECQGEACQPPASPPESQTPASATFQGPGNVKEEAPKPRCKQGKGGKCVAKKHKKAHKKHAKKSHKRTAGHNRGGAK